MFKTVSPVAVVWMAFADDESVGAFAAKTPWTASGTDGEISAIVTDAAAYGTGGYTAYPYAWRGTVPTVSSRYDMPYGPTEVDTLETFDYEQLQTRGTE